MKIYSAILIRFSKSCATSSKCIKNSNGRRESKEYLLILCDYLCRSTESHELFQLTQDLTINSINDRNSLARSYSSVSREMGNGPASDRPRWFWSNESENLSRAEAIKFECNSVVALASDWQRCHSQDFNAPSPSDCQLSFFPRPEIIESSRSSLVIE
jgi:hypothetical protein